MYLNGIHLGYSPYSDYLKERDKHKLSEILQKLQNPISVFTGNQEWDLLKECVEIKYRLLENTYTYTESIEIIFEMFNWVKIHVTKKQIESIIDKL